jgi:hypothetical protein
MSRGEWVDVPYVWHETNIVNCPVCGRLILRRAWEFDGGDGVLHVCDESCEELYESYLRPKHGVMHGRPARAAEEGSG